MKPAPETIEAAAACLAAGGLVAFPTETVYGLGADARNGEAVARLYAAKGRPAFNPLIAHVASAEAARGLGTFNEAAEQLAKALWPGPLTLVLPKQPGCPVCDLALAGLDSVAVRVPAHATARGLLAAFAGPIVAPSANRSGHVSPTSAAHVLADLRGRADMIIDAGPCTVGLESTIVSCLGEPTLLRPGGVTREAIERVLGRPLAMTAPAGATPLAPGLLAFGPAPAWAGPMLNLSPRGDLIEAAANLFSHLRALDAAGAATIAVMPVPREGLGEAINDRLRRAAAPKT